MENNKYIGEVKEKQSKEFSFILDETKNVNFVNPCCGSCTKVISYNKKEIKLLFTADSIPYHLQTNRWELTKCVDVNFTDGTQQRLSFRVIVVRDE